MPFKSVLIIDDDSAEGQRLAALAQRCGFTPTLLENGEDALKLLKSVDAPRFDAVVLDLVMPDLDGMSVLQALRGRASLPPVIVHTTPGGVDTVPSAIRAGAVDFLIRPVGFERLNVALGNACRMRALEAAARERPPGTQAPRLDDLVAHGPLMQRVRELATRAIKLPLPTLVVGPEGCGKKRLLRAIHRESDRSDRSLVVLTGGTATPGETKQALQSAYDAQGVLLVVDIDRLSAEAQTILAQGFENGILAFGSTLAATKKQVRLYATASQDLASVVREGRFRSDLYMRLAVQPISIPALCHRRDDIARLARQFVARASAEIGILVRELSADALALLESHDWPGDVRELEAVIYRATLLCNASVLETRDFPALSCRASSDASDPTPHRVAENLPLASPTPFLQHAPALPGHAISMVTGTGGLRSLEAVEAFAIRHALVHCGGHIGRAATELGIGRSTLYRRARDLGLLSDYDLLAESRSSQSHSSVAPPVYASAVPLGVVA